MATRATTFFFDDVDRHDFIETVAEVCQKTDWQLHAFCWMRNHYHLVVETPNPISRNAARAYAPCATEGSVGSKGRMADAPVRVPLYTRKPVRTRINIGDREGSSRTVTRTVAVRWCLDGGIEQKVSKKTKQLHPGTTSSASGRTRNALIKKSAGQNARRGR